MNKRKYLILASSLFLLGMNTTYAACTQEEINNFKKIEDNYTVKYEFDKATKTYAIYFERNNPNMYDFTVYTNENFSCTDINDTKAKCSPFKSGTYEIAIVGQTETCNNKLKTITMNLPKYNSYSEDSLCEGIEEFVLCNPTYDKEIDYETFKSRVETYKRTKEKTEVDNKNNQNSEVNNTFDKILDYVEENIVSIIIVLVFIILVLITIIITAKSVRKSRRLE